MQEETTPKKYLSDWKANAEEDYMNTPISVLRYISELEKLQTEIIDLVDMYFNKPLKNKL